MTSFRALEDGIRRVNRAPAIWVGVWAVTMIMSLPLAAAMREALATDLGSSLAADSAADSVNYQWMQEFADTATGLGVTFKPAILGFATVLDSLSGFLDRERQPAVIAGTAALYAAAWIFLAGGVLDRYARDRAIRAQGFFAAAGVFFFRFLRLAIIMAVVYVALFGWLHPWLFDTVYSRLTRELTVERDAFVIRVLLYAAFGAVLGACNIVFDYAKVRAVVEDRRSMMGALLSAVRFITRNFWSAVSLYGLDLVLFLLTLAAYALVASDGVGSAWSAWLAFFIGQAYIAARLWVKLVFWASESALFQGRLAHARYVAAPEAVWPESPSAEALGRT